MSRINKRLAELRKARIQLLYTRAVASVVRKRAIITLQKAEVDIVTKSLKDLIFTKWP